jgi:hypothetical protein
MAVVTTTNGIGPNKMGIKAVNTTLVNSVKQKIANNSGELTTDDLAEGISSDKHLLFNFLLDNNPKNISDTLKNKLGENLDFKPSRTQLEAIIDGYIQKDQYGKLQTILNNFKYSPNANNYTNHPEMHQKLAQKLPQ